MTHSLTHLLTGVKCRATSVAKNRKTNLSIYIRGDAAAGAELVGSVASFDECDDKKKQKDF